MDKKFKFSEQPISAKITYAVVVAMLLISAIVVGLVSASQANKDTDPDTNDPPLADNTDNGESNDGNGTDEGKGDEGEENGGNQGEEQKPTVYYSPVSKGSIAKSHSTTTPVFSETLREWRVHTGIDIAAEAGADVLAVAGGTVSKIRNDRFLGRTIEITHDGGIISVYSNLSSDGMTVSVGDTVKAGDKIGVIGDTSMTELADESHLHFEIMVSGASVNPLDYIEPDSQKNSLGVK